MREIAERASVTVQTVYAHFNSKAGLITSVVQEAAVRHGLVAGLERVWTERSPVGQLDEMVTVTFTFWHEAWALISFMLTALRQDPEFAAQVRAVNASRLADLETICEGLSRTNALRAKLRPKAAAALVFTMCSPYVYEDLVATKQLPYAVALRTVRDAVSAAVLRA